MYQQFDVSSSEKSPLHPWSRSHTCRISFLMALCTHLPRSIKVYNCVYICNSMSASLHHQTTSTRRAGFVSLATLSQVPCPMVGMQKSYVMVLKHVCISFNFSAIKECHISPKAVSKVQNPAFSLFGYLPSSPSPPAVRKPGPHIGVPAGNSS